MRRLMMAAAALALMAGPAAAAVVTITGGAPTGPFFDFAGEKADANQFVYDVGGTHVTATGTVFHHPTQVQRTASGLGVNGGKLDFEKDEVGASEKLRLTFDQDFHLAHIVIDDLAYDRWKTDQGKVALVNDGHVFHTVEFSALQAVNQLLTISFAGGAMVDALYFMIESNGILSAQNFAVRGISEVPVPAALPLLASGVGALAWLRRRRTAAA